MTTPNPQAPKELRVILAAPNVSEQMGGEALKALHIYLELQRKGVVIHQITHERVRAELERNFPQVRATYIADTALHRLLHRGKIFDFFLNLLFVHSTVETIRLLLAEDPDAVVHFTSPISPVLPYPHLPGARVVIGPINGNIHYPPAFRTREPPRYKLSRWLHPVMQAIHRVAFRGRSAAQVLLVAGGERTSESLILGGCSEAQLLASVDSGVPSRFGELPRETHSGKNLRFYYAGRLVDYKGTDLILRSLAKAKHPIEMDIIGSGPMLPRLRKLTGILGLERRVTFIDWVAHRTMPEMLRGKRGFVFPSLAEANGTVVQEAMVQGVPVIALNWGGPSLLVTTETGILIEPRSEQQVIDDLAAAMDRLAEDGELAESMSIAARARALEQGYLWPDVIQSWLPVYRRVMFEAEGASESSAMTSA